MDKDNKYRFSGEVARVAGEVHRDARFLLASESSFGPYAFIEFVQTEHEALLFAERKIKTEIYVEELSTDETKLILKRRYALTSILPA